jgi:Pyruvate/2-oxoacid:ferredoxin oxidoreductase delta subunit
MKKVVIIGNGVAGITAARTIRKRTDWNITVVSSESDHFYSRFRITTNGGQYMSCGACSTFCEMGINVRWYAQRGQNIIRASCVGCGVCAEVCPRGVLKLENGPIRNRYNIK